MRGKAGYSQDYSCFETATTYFFFVAFGFSPREYRRLDSKYGRNSSGFFNNLSGTVTYSFCTTPYASNNSALFLKDASRSSGPSRNDNTPL
jgi:hypothetical protein